MSNLRPESRIKSLEKRATTIEAAIEELSSDQAEEFNALRQDIKNLNDGMMTSFKKIGDTFIETVANKEDLEPLATKDDLGKLEARFDKVEGEITGLKATTNERFDRLESTQARQDAKLDTLLQLLQQKSGE